MVRRQLTLWFTQLASLSLIALIMTACNSGASSVPAASATQTPTPSSQPATSALTQLEIIELIPSSGPAGVAYPILIRILGRGFADSNTVFFGPVKLENVRSSNDGTEISFPGPKEVPVGEPAPVVLSPGQYEVVVENGNGRSNPLVFALN